MFIRIVGFVPKVKYKAPHYRSGEAAGEELGQQRSQIRIDRSTFFAAHEFLSQGSQSSLRDGVRGRNADRNLLRPGIRPTFRHELSVLSRAPRLRSNHAVLIYDASVLRDRGQRSPFMRGEGTGFLKEGGSLELFL